MRQVPGIMWREEHRTLSGPETRQLTKDELTALPLIDMSLVAGAEHRTTGVVWRSRGCPERCSFCEVCEIWPRYVLRDEEKSVEELLHLQRADVSGTFLIDDNAASNKPSFKRFLKMAIAGGYALPTVIQMRADAVFDREGKLDHELLSLLRDLSPATIVTIGVESSEDCDLAEVGKHITSERIGTALKAIRRYGILVHGMFIAFTNDTAETLKRNGRFARQYVTSLQYLFETPLPGTKATADHEAAGRVLFHDVTDLKFLDGMHVSILPEHMTAKEMQQVVIGEYRKFYSRTRVARAFFAGLFVRNRRLGDGLRLYLKTLPPSRRVLEWFRLHLQFKFAPWAILRVGRLRMLEFLKDADYLAYLAKLQREPEVRQRISHARRVTV